jgi:hypothetical protein
MGNSDEATMPDDLPFDETDLDMEDELEYNRGGVVEAANGTYVAPTIPTGIQPLATNPMGNPVGVPQQVADGVSGSTQGTPYVPNVGKMYGAGATPYAPVSYNQLLGPSATGAPTTETVRYFNAATGQTRMIPHLVNADGTRGATLYPVPEGFVIQEEAPKEEAKKTTQVQSTKVAPVDTDDGQSGYDEREREEAMYGRGAGRVNLGGKIDIEKTNRLGGPVRGSSLTKDAVTFGIAYADAKKGGIVSDLVSINIVKSAFDAFQYSQGKMPDDKVAIYTINGIPQVIPAKVHNIIAKNPRGPEALALIANSKKQKERFDVIKKVNPKLSRKEIIEMVTNMESADVDGSLTADNMKAIQEGLEAGVDITKQTDISEKAMQDRADKQAAEQRAIAQAKVANAARIAEIEAIAGSRATQPDTSGMDSSFGGGSGTSEPGGRGGDSTTGFGGDYGGTYKGSLITRNKPSKKKPKKMKRGGLASR